MRRAWDWFIIYAVPGPVYRFWYRWFWAPVRYHSMPWERSACDYCPACQQSRDDDGY